MVPPVGVVVDASVKLTGVPLQTVDCDMLKLALGAGSTTTEVDALLV